MKRLFMINERHYIDDKCIDELNEYTGEHITDNLVYNYHKYNGGYKIHRIVDTIANACVISSDRSKRDLIVRIKLSNVIERYEKIIQQPFYLDRLKYEHDKLEEYNKLKIDKIIKEFREWVEKNDTKKK